MSTNQLTSKIIGAAIEVHKHLGPGLLEHAYHESLAYELSQRGLNVVSEKSLPVIYKTLEIKNGYRVDLIIENSVIVEVKAIDRVMDVHRSQILTYMRMAECKTGLLINFHVKLLKEGIERFVL